MVLKQIVALLCSRGAIGRHAWFRTMMLRVRLPPGTPDGSGDIVLDPYKPAELWPVVEDWISCRKWPSIYDG